jgi:hypothetical protein
MSFSPTGNERPRSVSPCSCRTARWMDRQGCVHLISGTDRHRSAQSQPMLAPGAAIGQPAGTGSTHRHIPRPAFPMRAHLSGLLGGVAFGARAGPWTAPITRPDNWTALSCQCHCLVFRIRNPASAGLSPRRCARCWRPAGKPGTGRRSRPPSCRRQTSTWVALAGLLPRPRSSRWCWGQSWLWAQAGG